MRPIRICSLTILLAVLALLSAAPPATGQGPVCGEKAGGACFLPIEAGEAFFLYDELSDDDGDGDVDYIIYFVDGFNDFWLEVPGDGGKLFAHANEQNTEIIYCPFYAFDADWNFVPPDERCVYGEGNVSVNGFYDPFLFICPAEVTMRGSGWRASDGAPFKFSGKYVAVKNGDAETCGPGDTIKFKIKDNMP